MASMEPSVVGGWHLLQLPGCDARARFDAWQEEGALSGDKSIGCGLNALAFLNIFTRKEGERLLEELKGRDDEQGTTFREMMAFVYKEVLHDITQYEYDITTLAGISLFEQDMKTRLHEGSCTVIKLVRILETNNRNERMNAQVGLTGHSVVLSNERGNILLIDPQQGKLKEHDNKKALKVWSDLGYQRVYVMGKNSPNGLRHVTHPEIQKELKAGLPTFHSMELERMASAANWPPVPKPQYPVPNPFPQYPETPEERHWREHRNRMFREGNSFRYNSLGGSRKGRKRNRKTRHVRSS